MNVRPATVLTLALTVMLTLLSSVVAIASGQADEARFSGSDRTAVVEQAVRNPGQWPLQMGHVGTAPALAATDVITLGVATFLSGDPGAYGFGWRHLNGVQLAVDQVNDAGGLTLGGNNYNLALAVVDDQCSGAVAPVVAAQLIAEGAVAVIGHACSMASEPASAVYWAAGVPMVSPLSTLPRLTRLGYNTTFRNIPHDGSNGFRLASFMYYIQHQRRTALLIESDSPAGWGESIAQHYADTFSSLGGTIVYTATLSPTSSIPQALQMCRAANADSIVTSDWDGTLAGDVSRLADITIDMPDGIGWLGTDQTGETYQTEAGTAMEDDWTATARGEVDMPGYGPFASAYAAKNFTHEPVADMVSAYAYDAANIVIEAIRRADSTNPADIRDGIAATSNHPGVVGVYQGFDPYGDLIPQWGSALVGRNGKWVPMHYSTEFYPETGGTLNLGATWGHTTTVAIPAGAAAQTIVVTYTLVSGETYPNLPPDANVGQDAIRLEANLAPGKPVTLTVQYSDEDVADVDESTLSLRTWNGSAWVPADTCGPYIRDMENNILKAVLCHFSDYLLIGDWDVRVYSPMVTKRH